MVIQVLGGSLFIASTHFLLSQAKALSRRFSVGFRHLSPHYFVTPASPVSILLSSMNPLRYRRSPRPYLRPWLTAVPVIDPRRSSPAFLNTDRGMRYPTTPTSKISISAVHPRYPGGLYRKLVWKGGTFEDGRGGIQSASQLASSGVSVLIPFQGLCLPSSYPTSSCSHPGFPCWIPTTAPIPRRVSGARNISRKVWVAGASYRLLCGCPTIS